METARKQGSNLRPWVSVTSRKEEALWGGAGLPDVNLVDALLLALLDPLFLRVDMCLVYFATP